MRGESPRHGRDGKADEAVACGRIKLCVCVCVCVCALYAGGQDEQADEAIARERIKLCECVCVCMCVREKPETWANTLPVHTCIHTYVHTYIQERRDRVERLQEELIMADAAVAECDQIHTYSHIHIHTYIRTYIHTGKKIPCGAPARRVDHGRCCCG